MLNQLITNGWRKIQNNTIGSGANVYNFQCTMVAKKFISNRKADERGKE